MRRVAKTASTALLAVLLASCAAQSQAPVVDRSLTKGARGGVYTVRKNDTLYSIAWRYDLEYRDLAAINNISPPYLIHPGQRLRLAATTTRRSAAKSAATRPAAKPAAPRSKRPSPAPSAKPSPSRSPAAKPSTTAGAAPAWRRPVAVQPTRGFGAGSRGLDYTLKPATAIKAASAGVVVYRGPGLGGFRHLVIVKTRERYLVAYSVNVAPALREGDTVRPGTLIAKTGGGTSEGDFHFEIRDAGKPVDPAALLGG